MTRIAVISDIHGNMPALSAVLADAKAEGATRLFICGDITGYYYDTAQAWRVLSTYDTVMCRGNHEQILRDWIDGDKGQKDAIRRRYGSSYQRAAEDMQPAEINALLSLPHPAAVTVDGVRFLIAHGAPWDEDTYVYPDRIDDHLQRLAAYAADYDAIFMGHTHYQMAFRHGNVDIVNPGSAGQPRSGRDDETAHRSRAQWALYDTADRSCRLMTSMYDPAEIFAQVDRYDPDLPYLKKVLSRQEAAV